MKASAVYRVWGGYVLVAAVAQWLLGPFPVDWFAFPVGAAVMLLWGVAGWVLCAERRPARLAALLLSPHTTLALLGALVAAAMVQGLTAFGVTTTWWFVAIMLALLTHLLLITVRGIRRFLRPHGWRFALIHVGVLLALGAGFWGAADTHTWRLALTDGRSVRQAVDRHGRLAYMPHTLTLRDFQTEHYADGSPRSHRAVVQIDQAGCAVLQVNHPYRLSWKDHLYLMGTGPDYCVVEWVSQPWQVVQQAGIGMLMAGVVLLFAQGVGRRQTSKNKPHGHME